MKKNLFFTAFIAVTTMLSVTAFSQTSESFPSPTFNSAGTAGVGGAYTGNQGAWAFTVAANSIIEVDGTTFTSSPNALRMANTNTSSITSATATSPKINLVYGACLPSALSMVFQLQPTDAANNNTNYTITLQFSSNDGGAWANAGWSLNADALNDIEDVWNTITVPIPNIYWNPNFRYRFVSNRSTANSTVTALLIDDITFVPTTTGPAFPDFSDNTPTETTDAGGPGGGFEVGDVYRFDNVVTSPYSIYAEVKIEAMVNASITTFDNNAGGIAQRFQPRIVPTGLPLTADKEGYIQFAITFKKTSDNSLEFLDGLRYRHFDVDGSTGNSGTGTYSFRESGWVTGHSSVFVNNPSDLFDAGNIVDAGPPVNTNWKKILGELDEHTGLTSDPDVYFTATYGAINTIRFRLGYVFDELTNGASYSPDAAGREYGTEFGCFDLVDQSTLPVKLLGFNGTYRNQSALLNWETVNEQSFNNFIVERSSNGADFAAIGSKQATGAADYLSKQNYNYTDDLSAVAGTVFYYRLKMVDIDGKFKYSNIIMIRKDGKAINGISISPNPVNNSNMATVRVTAVAKGSMDLKVIDMSGKVLLTQQNKVTEGNNSISINNLDRLQAGLYIVQLQNGAEVLNTKLSIIR